MPSGCRNSLQSEGVRVGPTSSLHYRGPKIQREARTRFSKVTQVVSIIGIVKLITGDHVTS